MNRISCYGIFMQEEFPEGLTYGIGTYHEGDGSLMAYSPGQICGKLDDGTRRQYHGWVLLFDNELIQGSLIEQKLDDYQFFSYHSNEALILTPEEKDVLSQLMANLRRELETQSQSFGHNEIIRNFQIGVAQSVTEQIKSYSYQFWYCGRSGNNHAGHSNRHRWKRRCC